MADELKGKVAVITGGANGIGRAMVEAFVAEGARVVIADLDEAAGAVLADELGELGVFQRTDVADVESVTSAVDLALSRFGAIDVMVNNAGIASSPRRFLTDDFRDFERVMGVDLFGVMVGTQVAAKKMSNGGSVINTSSIAGLVPGVGLQTYRAAKAGVIHFTKCAAIELGELGVRVNAIAPGNIATNINAQFDAQSIMLRMQPLQRAGTPTDIANAAVFLASDRSAQITGVVIPVDGGTTAGPPPMRPEEVAAKKQ